MLAIIVVLSWIMNELSYKIYQDGNLNDYANMPCYNDLGRFSTFLIE